MDVAHATYTRSSDVFGPVRLLFAGALVVQITLGFIGFFAGFFFPSTRMLTELPGFQGGNVVRWLFWIALATGCGAAMFLNVKWHKKIVSALAIAFLSMAMMMPAMYNYERILEARVFSGTSNRVSSEPFRFVETRSCGKGGRCSEIVGEHYNITPSVSISKPVAELLERGTRRMPANAWQYWPSRTITDYCVRFKVEHVGNNARILVKTNVRPDHVFRCSPGMVEPKPASAV